jgi:hypothetical protein
MAILRRDKPITEEVIELEGLSIDACRKLKGTPTPTKTCVVRLETDSENPMEAHLRKVDFKSAGQYLDTTAEKETQQ